MSPNIYPTIFSGELGWLSEEQMIEVDRVMIEDLNIELIQMMENAGRNLARVVLDLFRPASVIVYAGSGGNGGGGLAAARHLSNAGVGVAISLSRQADQLSGVPGHQLDILQRMGIATTAPGHADVAVDALIGYSLRGAPTRHTATLIEQMPRTADAVVSLDTPSGLNVTTGEVPGVVVVADATLTLALPKLGLREAREVGELYVGDISVPPHVMDQVDARPPNFADSPILRVTR
jgi:NAD(P)H-hydrate epimerase